MWIKKNDTVVIIKGDDRGARGRVLRVVRDKTGGGAGRVVVEGVNRVYRHVRRSQRNPQGGRLSVEMPVAQSNVALLCPGCGSATRIARGSWTTARRNAIARSAGNRSARSCRRSPRGSKRRKWKRMAKKSKEAPAEAKGPKKVPTPRLMERYFKEVVPNLRKKFSRTNVLSFPRLKKIVVNMGVGKAITEKKFIEEAVEAMKTIVGQKPVVTRSRLSIAGFKLREGQAVGCKVTLRGKRMYEFLDRLISLALPRVRDFRGLDPSGFDGHGNYSLGLTEQLVFPELNPDKFTNVQGMHVTIVTNSGSDDESRELLRAMGMPFRAA